MTRKVIIDTDPGIDDAMAIFLALNSPEIDVIGITTVFGNAPRSKCTANALRLLEISDRLDIPVASGFDHPLTRPTGGDASHVHGIDGQGNTYFPSPKLQAVDKHAVSFMINEINRQNKKITIVALGPLTNIAMALRLQPEIAQNIEEIVLMGGNAFVSGNVSPAAEANIWNDPEAADMVFNAACPVTMIGLDVTEKILMTSKELDLIGTFNNSKAQYLARILPFYRNFYKEHVGIDGIYVHDSTTFTYLINPAIFTSVHYPICVETTGISRGKTWPARHRSELTTPWISRNDVNICVDVISSEAIHLQLTRLQI